MVTVHTNIDPKKLSDAIVAEAMLVNIGTQVIAIVRERTNRGEFLEGSSPGSEKYSRKPAHMPLEALKQRVGITAAARAWKVLKNETHLYRQSRTGKIWVLLERGYEQVREIGGRETDRVTLNWTGSMMRAMDFETDVKTGTVTVRFTDAESAQKAAWLTEGAGRNRIRRIFMALSADELSRVVGEAEKRVVV